MENDARDIVDVIRKKLSNFGMPDPKWQDLLIDNFGNNEETTDLAKLNDLLKKLSIIVHPQIDSSKYFAFTHSIAPDSVRVIILGESVAPKLKSLGYAFGTEGGPSSSLKMLCRCIEEDFNLEEDQLQPSGCLDGWISQGVLLMNVNIINKEETRFQPIIAAIIRGLFQANKKIMHLLFGRLAKEVFEMAFRQTQEPSDENVLKMYHPSASYRIGTPSCHITMENFMENFYEKQPFLSTNQRLEAMHGDDAGIDWKRLDQN